MREGASPRDHRLVLAVAQGGAARHAQAPSAVLTTMPQQSRMHAAAMAQQSRIHTAAMRTMRTPLAHAEGAHGKAASRQPPPPTNAAGMLPPRAVSTHYLSFTVCPQLVPPVRSADGRAFCHPHDSRDCVERVPTGPLCEQSTHSHGLRSAYFERR